MSRLRSSAYLIGGNVVSSVIAFFAIPFYMKWFDEATQAGYSAYLYLVAAWGFISLVCPDFATGAQKRLTEHIAAGRKDLASAVTQVLVGATLANGLLALVLAAASGFFVHYGARSLMAMFLLAALVSLARSLAEVGNAILRASERFGAIALRQSIESLAAVSASVAFAYTLRKPEALLLGMGAGSLVGMLVNLTIIRRSLPEFSLAPAFHWQPLRDLLVLHVKALPHTIVGQVAGGLDRLLIDRVKIPVADYAVPYRLPETLNQLLAPAIDTVVPELTRQSAADQSDFARAIDRYGMQALIVSTTLILVPSGWGAPFLTLWLGSNAPKGGGLVVLLIGLYFCLNFYFSTLTRAFRATGEMHWIFPFSLFNALVTAFVTIPAARWGGIAGVAAMNAAINVVQIVPFAFFMRRAATKQFPAPSHALKATTAVGIGSAAAYAGYWVGATDLVTGKPWLCFLFAPLWMLVAGFALFSLRLAPIPNGLLRFAPRRLRQ
jgi:O-antigen/teichoic acid export membrane protein